MTQLVKNPPLKNPPLKNSKGFPDDIDDKDSACNTGEEVRSLGWKYPLEKGMATHSSILSWRISWTEVPGGGYSPWDHKESDTTEQLTLLSVGQELRFYSKMGMRQLRGLRGARWHMLTAKLGCKCGWQFLS